MGRARAWQAITAAAVAAAWLAVPARSPASSGPDYATLLTNAGPVAEAGPDVAAAVGVPVPLDASGSSDPDGTVVTARWDFGDGTTATGRSVSHTWAREGEYIVNLTVRDDRGHIGSDFAVAIIGSPPEVRRETIAVRTSFGTLNGVVLRPDASARVPVILEYTPYPVTLPFIQVNTRTGSALARSGFAVASIEAPGTGSSEGTFDFFGPGAQQAGVEVVEDLASRPWAEPKVGLVGYSGPGILGALTAARNPPHLVASAFAGIYGDLYRDWIYPGGVLNSYALNYLAGLAAFRWPNDPQGGSRETAADLERILGNPFDGPFWRERSPADVIHRIATPVLLQAAWNDLYPREAPWMGARLQHPNGRVLVYPGPHVYFDPTGDHVERPVRAEEFSTTSLERGSEVRTWFERALLGMPHPPGSRSSWFETGGGLGAAWSFGLGRWVDEPWPPTAGPPARLYLHPGGVLDPDVPAAGAPATILPYEPTVGASDPLWWDWATSTNGFRGNPYTANRFHFAADDQAVEDARSAAFTSAPFDAATLVTGPATATLWIEAVAAGDPDWVIRIEEVWPDGSSHFLSKGVLRTSHRVVDPGRSIYQNGLLVRPYHPHDAELRAPPGPIRIDVEIWPMANRFRPGTRLRVAVALANSGYAWLLPRDPAPAVRILHDADHPSFLVFGSRS